MRPQGPETRSQLQREGGSLERMPTRGSMGNTLLSLSPQPQGAGTV